MIKRLKINSVDYIEGYHVQEHRFDSDPLSEPIRCIASDAWLGVGYYFWVNIEFAKYWGKDKKNNCYDIYIGFLKGENLLDAVFSEEGYTFFVTSIEEAITYLTQTNNKLNIDKVHKFLADKIWKRLGISGIIYGDIPQNPKSGDRTYSLIPPLYYKKRIQIVVFESKNIYKFDLLEEYT